MAINQSIDRAIEGGNEGSTANWSNKKSKNSPSFSSRSKSRAVKVDPAADPSKRLQRQLRFQQFCQHSGPSRSPHQRRPVCVCGHSAVRGYMSGGQWRSVNLSGSREESVLPSGCYVFRGRLRRGSGWPIYQSQRFHPVDFVHESCGRCQRHAVVN